MSLLIDCGNTRCKLVRLLADGSLSPILAIPNEAVDFVARLDAWLGDVAAKQACYFASVANAEVNAKIEMTLASAGFSITRIKTQAQALGMRIAYPEPQQMGVDRFLALIAAHRKKQSLLLVSAGSALTVDVLDALGVHHGGMITATETIVLNAMENRFANFRHLSGMAKGFSDNTADALASGARYMVLGIIEKSWREARLMLAEPELPILLTGGDAEALLPHLPDNTIYQPALVLEGLALWAGHLESH